MGLNFKSKLEGDFIQKIDERLSKLSQVNSIAATIVVPDDMIWWYYNEYGTASSYEISPVSAGALAFPGAGGTTVIRSKVLHPPIKASHMVEIVREEIRTFSKQAILERLKESDFNTQEVKSFLFSDVMLRVKEIIRDSFALQLPGTRLEGKLQGKSAAEVFDNEATIVDTSV